MCWSHHSNVTWVLPNNMWLSFECVGSCLNMCRSYLIIWEPRLYSGPHIEPTWTCVGPTWAYRQASFQPKSYITSCDLTYAGPNWLCRSYETHFDIRGSHLTIYGSHCIVGPTWGSREHVWVPRGLSSVLHSTYTVRCMIWWSRICEWCGTMWWRSLVGLSICRDWTQLWLLPGYSTNYSNSSERACSLVVTRAPVAPQVLGSTPRGSEFLRI
jgi:hypothetical protein